MIIMTNIIFAITGIYTLFIFVKLADIQRSQLGNKAGNILFFIECGAIAILYLGYKLWKKGKKREAGALGLFIGVIIFVFFGWILSPYHVYMSTLDRVLDLEFMISDSNNTSPKVEKYREVELSARKLELKANEIRYIDNPNLYRSYFNSWSLWGFAAILAINGIFCLISRNSHIRINENQ